MKKKQGCRGDLTAGQQIDNTSMTNDDPVPDSNVFRQVIPSLDIINRHTEFF
jgi:hypothetical protein